jgi:hypothetical protein
MLAEGVSEHRVQNGFANTDLHHQPKEHTIKEIAIDTMVMNACIESTGPSGTDRLSPRSREECDSVKSTAPPLGTRSSRRANSSLPSPRLKVPRYGGLSMPSAIAMPPLRSRRSMLTSNVDWLLRVGFRSVRLRPGGPLA